MVKIKNWNKYKKYFKPGEFDSKGLDGKYIKDSGRNNMDKYFMNKLYKSRKKCPYPFRIRQGSGYRTPAYDKLIGGKGNHPEGKAADIPVRNSKERFAIAKSVMLRGFDRVGIARTFIHVDTIKRKDKEVLWLY